MGRFDTFSMDNCQLIKGNWKSFGLAIDDLKESYDKCSQSELSLEEWNQALENLDDDFIAVQEYFEMLTAIHNLYRAYVESNADDVDMA